MAVSAKETNKARGWSYNCTQDGKEGFIEKVTFAKMKEVSKDTLLTRVQKPSPRQHG
jgi:hypothetical protein